jgi:alginate O-acetyltransferase complex protein AlgI
VWGGLHGVYLLVNHAWRAAAARLNLALPKAVAWLVTFLSVVAAWVFFRADGVGDAAALLERMFNLEGVSPTAALSKSEYPLLTWVEKRPLFATTALGLVLALRSPNILRALRYSPDSEKAGTPVRQYPLVFTLALGFLFFAAVKRLLNAAPSEFLYFNF